MKRFLLTAALLVFAAVASADTGAYSVTQIAPGCTIYEMCRAEDGTGVCDSGSDAVVASNLGNVSLFLTFAGSAAGVEGNLECCVSTWDDCADGVSGIDRFSSEITLTSEGQYSGVAGFCWVELSANPNNDADAWLTVCQNE